MTLYPDESKKKKDFTIASIKATKHYEDVVVTKSRWVNPIST